MGDRPVIGITKPDDEDLLAFYAIWLAVRLAGGAPEILTPSADYHSHAVDGLVLGGGKDVFPGLYNQAPKAEYRYDQARDEMEVFWAERAREEEIPTLGICRGAQLMNVIAGGTLHMSVREAYDDAHYPDGFLHHAFYRKAINIKPHTLLHRITGCKSLKVNSIHKQAIAKLGNGFKIDATENNGVVQAIAAADHPFYLGVQFHPEFLIYRRAFRNIFRALVSHARERAAKV